MPKFNLFTKIALRPLLILLCLAASGIVRAADSGSDITKAALQAELLRFIALSQPNRSVGMSGHEKAYDYLKKEFQKIAEAHSGKVLEHSFRPDVDFAIRSYQNDFDTKVEGKIAPEDPEYRKWKVFTNDAVSFVKKYQGNTGRNLILELKGTQKPAEVIYVGAHYDTITHDHVTMKFTPAESTEGADDNASSLIGLLAAAREIAATPHDRTVRFVAFDFEEIFFLGSYALAKDIKGKKLSWAPATESFMGLFNLEMIGWSKAPLSKKSVMKLYIRSPKEPGASSDLALAKMYQDAVRQAGLKLKPEILENGFDRSDQWAFWQLGFPGVCISQDWEGDFDEKNYHTSHDSPKNLNMDYLTEIVRGIDQALKIALTSR